jgi:hypothetical protein
LRRAAKIGICDSFSDIQRQIKLQIITISREGFSLKISFFEVCRRWAVSCAGVLFLTGAVVLGLGCVCAPAQEASPATGVAAQPATASGQATPQRAGSAQIGTSSIETNESSSGTGASGDGQSGQAAQSVPDAPKPQGQTAPQGQAQTQGQTTTQGQGSNVPPSQTNRILDIIPNFRAVSTDEKLPPMSVKDKFVGATEDSFDYSAIFIPLALAEYSMLNKDTPEFGTGWPGYARYFWHTAVDQTSENYMVEFIVPSVTHEDTRYYTLGRGGFLKRAGYALSRAVITRNDKGKDEFNISEVVGAGASSGISSLYYPSKERSLGSVGLEWGLDVAIDSMSFVVKEFWPDVNHALFHKGQSNSSPATASH